MVRGRSHYSEKDTGDNHTGQGSLREKIQMSSVSTNVTGDQSSRTVTNLDVALLTTRTTTGGDQPSGVVTMDSSPFGFAFGSLQVVADQEANATRVHTVDADDDLLVGTPIFSDTELSASAKDTWMDIGNIYKTSNFQTTSKTFDSFYSTQASNSSDNTSSNAGTRRLLTPFRWEVTQESLGDLVSSVLRTGLNETGIRPSGDDSDVYRPMPDVSSLDANPSLTTEPRLVSSVTRDYLGVQSSTPDVSSLDATPSLTTEPRLVSSVTRDDMGVRSLTPYVSRLDANLRLTAEPRLLPIGVGHEPVVSNQAPSVERADQSETADNVDEHRLRRYNIRLDIKSFVDQYGYGPKIMRDRFSEILNLGIKGAVEEAIIAGILEFMPNNKRYPELKLPKALPATEDIRHDHDRSLMWMIRTRSREKVISYLTLSIRLCHLDSVSRSTAEPDRRNMDARFSYIRSLASVWGLARPNLQSVELPYQPDNVEDVKTFHRDSKVSRQLVSNLEKRFEIWKEFPTEQNVTRPVLRDILGDPLPANSTPETRGLLIEIQLISLDD